MSIATEITRLQNAKAAIKTAIEGKGVTVPDATLFDGMAALIDAIEAGGGGSVEPFSEVLTGTVTFASASTTWTLPKSDNLLAAYFLRYDIWDDNIPSYYQDYCVYQGAFLTAKTFMEYFKSSVPPSVCAGYNGDYSGLKHQYDSITLSGSTLTIGASTVSRQYLNYFYGTYWYALVFGVNA